MIKVLIVEDSPSHQALLEDIISSDAELQVVAVLGDGVLMDIHMPKMDGLQATRRIMERQPVPIVITSAVTSSRDVATTFDAIQSGALMFLDKPHGPDAPDYPTMKRRLINTLKSMAGVRVLRRQPSAGSAPGAGPAAFASNLAPQTIAKTHRPKIIAVGASTGGPPALQLFLNSLPRVLPVPVVIVQHIAHGFMAGMVEWLERATVRKIRQAAHGETLEPCMIYFAPDRQQLRIGKGGRVELSDDASEYGVRPSVSCLFRSVALAYKGDAAGVLLTGMGTDGAMELKAMRDAGGLTYAQDAASCVVNGMPGEAVKLGGAMLVMDPTEIALHLSKVLQAAENPA